MERKPHDRGQSSLSFEAIFEQELKDVLARRVACYGSENFSYVDSNKPTVANRLVGLALSGGGPRAAVFNLGVLQALHRHGVFQHVDYLSTVSGGGYIGSTLMNLLSEGGRDFPFAAGPRGGEAPLVSWIRNQSVHLAPRRFLDYALRAAVFFRGVLLNFLALTPVLLLVAVGIAMRFKPLAKSASGGSVPAWWELISNAYFLTPISLVVSIVFLAVWSFVYRLWGGGRAQIATAAGRKIGSRNANRTVWAMALFVNSVILIFGTLLILLQALHLALPWPVSRGALLLATSAVSVAVVAAAGPLLGSMRGRWRKAVGVALLACWPVAPIALVLYVAHGLVYSWPPFWPRLGSWVWFPVTVLWIPTAWLMVDWFVALTDPVFSRASSRRFQALLSTLTGLLAVAAAGALVLGSGKWWHSDDPVWFILALTAVLFLLVWTVYDANASSTFGFFRDLLCAAFLVKMTGDSPKEVAVFTDPEPRPLGEDHKNGFSAPYHLINTSLNLHGSDDSSLGDRINDGFLLSKRAYGSSRTDYWWTGDLEAVFPSMDLATATAAAATSTAPNFINTSSRLLGSLLALLNLRPGYWLPNPRRLARFASRRTGSVEGSLWNRGVWKVGLQAYLLEIKGKLTDDQRWVNVADGGYFDSLGLYELLRRRCRYIVVSDAGADPERSSSGLAKLTRLARTDLGIEIEMGLEALAPGDRSLSRHHAAVGVIQYPPSEPGDSPEKGVLVYVEPTLTGDENRGITEYAVRQAAFPHESRMDRFFGEGQFDAYRDLGFHSVDGLFDPVGPGESAFQLDRNAFFEWLETLRSRLSPKPEAASGASGAEGEVREPDRRREQQKTEEKLFAANLKKKIVLEHFQIDGHSFFADGLSWRFQPRINVLLGRNGYGKTFLLRGLAALLQKDEEVSEEFFLTSAPEASARIHLLRDQEEGLIARGGSAEESLGKIPLLAIPDSRFINRSNVLVAPTADVHVGDLKADGAYHFLHQLPYEASVLTFLLDVCFDYFQRRQRFKLPVFEMIHDVVRELTHQTFRFHNIEKRDQARFLIEVLTEGNEDNPLPIQQVSQGTFSVIAMFGQIFNFLKSVHAPAPDREICDKPAIVIIDEIDAHLHPLWQRRIVQLLRTTFPGVQFVLTAHSPLVVAGCLQDEVSVLKPKPADGAEAEVQAAQSFEVYQFGHDFIGWPPERIYRAVFQVEGPDDSFLHYSALEPKEGSLQEAVKELEGMPQRTPEDEDKLRQAREDLEGIEAARRQRDALRETREIVMENKRLERKVRVLARQVAQLTGKSENPEPGEMGGKVP